MKTRMDDVAGMSQHVAHSLMEFGTSASREAASCFAEQSQVEMDLVRRLQEATSRWQSMWPELMRDPTQWYLKVLEAQTTVTRECLRAMRRNAEAFGKSLQRIEASAEEASRAVHKAFADSAGVAADGRREAESRRAA
jgi:uncharacterized protein Yka (UPF0111/DUF47 family)